MYSDSSGVVSAATFLNCVFYSFKTYKTLEDLKDAFRTFDGDGRGVLTQSELRYILTTLGEPLSQEEMNGFLVECMPESIQMIERLRDASSRATFRSSSRPSASRLLSRLISSSRFRLAGDEMIACTIGCP